MSARKDRILLVDTDSKIPNVALTRLSTFHKIRGDEVSLRQVGLSGYPGPEKIKKIDARGFDQVYVSTIFTHNQHLVNISGAANVQFGGSGVDLKKTLPFEVENMPMDYSVYPGEHSIAYGFLTRGCDRRCSFCIVHTKEGNLHKVCNLKDIIKPGHRAVKLLDNNILAYPGHEEILLELIRMKIKCTFSQGLDIRHLTETNAKLLERLNYIEEYIFAFDDVKLTKKIEEKMALLKRINFIGRLKFFIFTSPKYTCLADDVFRVKWCIEHGHLAYLMRENTCWQSEHKFFYIDLASWCNQPKFFKKMDFRTFLSRRHPHNIERQEKSADIFYNNHRQMASFHGDVAHLLEKPVKPGMHQMMLFD